ncbi:MAG: hypothetical protein GF392_03490, partial [Candidatus Omnitrophica bacterium]|nr:hypothetical protein [Candidatus Omnitrophota bacterium]
MGNWTSFAVNYSERTYLDSDMIAARAELSRLRAEERVLEVALRTLGVNDPSALTDPDSELSRKGYADGKLSELLDLMEEMYGEEFRKEAETGGIELRIRLQHEKIAAALPPALDDTSSMVLRVSLGKDGRRESHSRITGSGFESEEATDGWQIIKDDNYAWSTSLTLESSEPVSALADDVAGYSDRAERHIEKGLGHRRQDRYAGLKRQYSRLAGQLWEMATRLKASEEKLAAAEVSCDDAEQAVRAGTMSRKDLRALERVRDSLRDEREALERSIESLKEEIRLKLGLLPPAEGFLKDFSFVLTPLTIDNMMETALEAAEGREDIMDPSLRAIEEQLEATRLRQSAVLHRLSGMRIGISALDSNMTATPVDGALPRISFTLYGQGDIFGLNKSPAQIEAEHEHSLGLFQLRKRQKELPDIYRKKLVDLQSAAEMMRLELKHVVSISDEIREQAEGIIRECNTGRIDLATMKARLEKIDRSEYMAAFISFVKAYNSFSLHVSGLGMPAPGFTLTESAARTKEVEDAGDAAEKASKEWRTYTAGDIPAPAEYEKNLERVTGWRWSDFWDGFKARHRDDPEKIAQFLKRNDIEETEMNKAGFHAFREGLRDMSSGPGYLFGEGGALYRNMTTGRAAGDEKAAKTDAVIMDDLNDLRDVYWDRFWEVQEEVVIPVLEAKLGFKPDVDNDFDLIMAWTDYLMGKGRSASEMIDLLRETKTEAFIPRMVERMTEEYERARDEVELLAAQTTADELQSRVETRDTDMQVFRGLMADLQDPLAGFLKEELSYQDRVHRWTFHRAGILALRSGGIDNFSNRLEMMAMVRRVSGAHFSLDGITPREALEMPSSNALRRLAAVIEDKRAAGENTSFLEELFNERFRAFVRGHELNTAFEVVKWFETEKTDSTDWLKDRKTTLAEALEMKRQKKKEGREHYLPLLIVYIEKLFEEDPEYAERISSPGDLFREENRDLLRKVMRYYFADLDHIFTEYRDFFTRDRTLGRYDLNNPRVYSGVKKWVRFYKENFSSKAEFDFFMRHIYGELVGQKEVIAFLNRVAKAR